MVRRKDRIPVVLDTNVLVGFFLGRSRTSANAKVMRLWFIARELQLIVSDATVSEYLETLQRVAVAPRSIEKLDERIEKRETVTRVSLGARPTDSRDPDDNLMLATALVGKAKYLITNDKDLLDIPATGKKKFKFRIVTPAEFLAHWEE